MLDFAVDPITVVEVCGALYEPELEAAGISPDDFEEMCDADTIEALRAEVTQQMRGFSKFWKILSTEMDNLLSGDTNLIETAEKLKGAAAVASGPSS